jgi:excisionase family DNA binding protein
MKNLELKRLLSVEEAARYFDCHPDTIRRHIRAGNIDYLKLGKTIKIPRVFLDQMIADRVKLATPVKE